MRYLGLTMTELHELYVSGKATPLDVVNEVIEALTKDKNNILEKQCMTKHAVWRKVLLKLKKIIYYGEFLLVKDNIAMKGIETTGSSNILNGFIPLCNAEVIDKLLAAKQFLLQNNT